MLVGTALGGANGAVWRAVCAGGPQLDVRAAALLPTSLDGRVPLRAVAALFVVGALVVGSVERKVRDPATTWRTSAHLDG